MGLMVSLGSWVLDKACRQLAHWRSMGAMTPELAEYFDTGLKEGVVITGVLQNGPAAQAGIQPGDVIASLNERPVDDVGSLLAEVAALKPGQTVAVEVWRQKQRQRLQITPGRRPTSPADAAR